MKILLISGHGNGDVGAVGCGLKEAEETRRVTKALAEKLGCDVYPVSRNAFEDAKRGTLNVRGYDYVLEIHFNAFNSQAYGTETYYPSLSTITGFENEIIKAMSKYFVVRNGGIHSGKFAVINTAYRQGAKANLLEVAFIDNAKDMKIYQSKFDSIIEDLANAIEEDNMTGEQIYNKLCEYNEQKFEKDKSWAESMIAEAKDLGITDGSRLFEPISMYRCVCLMLKAYKKGKAEK